MMSFCLQNDDKNNDVSIGNESGKSLALRTISREVVAQDTINTFTNQSTKVSTNFQLVTHSRSNQLTPQLINQLTFYILESKIGDNIARNIYNIYDVVYW